MQEIVATRFKLSQPSFDDDQPASPASRALTQAGSSAPDCAALDASLSRELQQVLIGTRECEREFVGLPQDRAPSSSGEETSDESGGAGVISDQPVEEVPVPSSGSGDDGPDLALILGLALGLGLGLSAAAAAVYLVVVTYRRRTDGVLTAAMLAVGACRLCGRCE